MVADYFPPLQRARAMALYTTSIPIGLLVGSLIGGFVAHAWGWRMAFVVAGIPGILLAVLARYTVREPERGLLDSAASGHGATVVPSFREAMRILFRNRTFVHIVVAAATGGLAVYGVNSFGGPYFMRQHGLDAAETGIVLASGLGVAGLVGTLFGGFMADRFAASDPRVYVLVPAVGAALSGLFFIVSFMQSNWLVAAAFFILAYLFNGFKNGPSFAAVLNLFPSRMRATAAAVNLMAITLIGLGLGPLLVGGLSDLVAAATVPAQLGDFAESCPGGRALASRAAELGAACTGASATGVRAGLTAAAAVYFLSMLHYLLAARTIRQHMTV
jgi:predicted MFS family arabinose efflux permease